jgi:hypothetical protein
LTRKRLASIFGEAEAEVSLDDGFYDFIPPEITYSVRRSNMKKVAFILVFSGLLATLFVMGQTTRSGAPSRIVAVCLRAENISDTA